MRTWTPCSTPSSRIIIERLAGEVNKGAVFLDPDIKEPTVLRFLVGEVIDGNGEVVRRAFGGRSILAAGRIEPTPGTSFDVVPLRQRAHRRGSTFPWQGPIAIWPCGLASTSSSPFPGGKGPNASTSPFRRTS